MSSVKKFRIIRYKAATKPVLKIKNISKSFNEVPVLQNLNLNIFPGSINGLLGENGSGKTTLFGCILGILQAEKGEIYGKGNTLISDMPIHERCKLFKLSYIPQRTSLFTGLSTLDNLRAVAQCKYNNKRKIDESVDKLLTEFSLSDVANIKADKLSGGQRKKVSIARALIGDPEIILMDEIFAALSPKSIENIKKIIVGLQISRKSLSILISDHIYQHILDLSDTVHILSDGKIVRSQKAADIITDPVAVKAYFGDI